MAASMPRMPGRCATLGQMSSLPARRFLASQTTRRRFAPCVAEHLRPGRDEGPARCSSCKLFCEFCEVCDNEVGLVGPVAEGALSAVNEAGCHTKRFSPNAIERMVGDKQDLMRCQAYDL